MGKSRAVCDVKGLTNAAKRRDARERPTKRQQMLGVAALATHPQKAVFQAAALEIVVEFTLDIARQFYPPLCQMREEDRVIFFGNPA